MTVRPTITQAMIDAYDEYTHLSLDRRDFMDKLTRLAGSGAAAAVIAPMLAANQAQAAIIAADDTRVMGEEVIYDGGAGQMKGYLVKPADAPAKLPAVIVIHENRGLNEHIRDVARRVAVEGFIALAPDFLSPAGGTPGDEDKAREMIGQLNAADTRSNAVAAVDWLKGRADSTGKVGAVGFCWGGGLVNDLAVGSPDLAAGVPYYGRQPDVTQVPSIQASLLLQYAGLDDRINAGIGEYTAALETHGKEYAMHMYSGAQHAFNNDTSSARYNKEASDLAWGRTIAFFKEKLGA